MFLRSTKRFKDGKQHTYWSMVENVRVGRRVFQRQALYLGELNDSQREEWQRAIEAFDEKGNVRQLKLFPEDRAPETDDGQVVRIRMDRLTVRNVRNWGEVWLGLELWDKLGLDGFWTSRLGPSRKGTDWLALMKAIVLYRFTDPGSELRMHTNWLANTAVGELIGPGALTGRSTLYSCLDRVLWNSEEWKKPRGERKGSFKDEFLYFLRDRWAGLFASTCDVVLFDLTSTYFEVDGTKALESDLQRYGYSRDKRGDCLQVVVALVLTPRQIIDKFRAVKMVDVVMPTTDGRIVTLPRYVEPKPDLVILLDRLGLTLPAQPPPKISSEAADAAKSTV